MGTPQPKPQPRPKRARQPLKRTRMRRKASRRLKGPGSDPAYLAFVHTLPCVIGWSCKGPIHAHHAGKKPGTGMKAPDSTAIPLCMFHHDCWHDGSGYFRNWTKADRRDWSAARIAETRAAYEAFGGPQ